MPDHASTGDHGDGRIMDRLNKAFYELWAFGGNALIGWMPLENGISVLVAPVITVFQAAAADHRIFSGERMMDAGAFAGIAGRLRVKPREITLGDMGAPSWRAVSRDGIDALFARYAVTRTDHRAAFLLDIAGFALYSPEEQAAQLSVLGYSLNIAAEKASRHGIDIDLARSTTGDGFYVWNRRLGYAADVNLFCVLMIALAHQALQQRSLTRSFAPTTRTCFGVGSHYSFFQLNRLDPMGSDYIVGDLTIGLARLIDHAGPNQILVEDFRRPGDSDARMVGAEDLLESAARVLDGFKDIDLGTDAVTRISTYLTGERNPDGAFNIRKLTVQDKHGHSRSAYNAKVNIFLKDGDPIFLGLRDADIA